MAPFFDTGELFPAGPGRRLYRCVQPIVESLLGFPKLWALQRAALGQLDAAETPPKTLGELGAVPVEIGPSVARGLRHLGVTVQWEPTEIARLRAIEGPLVVVSNHPFGGLDFMALVGLLEAVRPGQWCFFANRLVTALPGLGGYFLAVEPLKGDAAAKRLNAQALRAAKRHLAKGGMVGLFPAGRVSHREQVPATVGRVQATSEGGASGSPKPGALAEAGRGWRVVDRAWSDHFLRLAADHGASVASIYFPGSNRRGFLRWPRHWAAWRALWLCRELTNPPTTAVQPRLGEIYSPEEVAGLAREPSGAARIRARCFLTGDLNSPVTGELAEAPGTSVDQTAGAAQGARDSAEHRVSEQGAAAVPSLMTAPAGSSETTHEAAGVELAALPGGALRSHGRYQLFLAVGSELPVTLPLLGALREETFRAAGQGTGRAIDLSPEDHYYHHLLLWDSEAHQLAGAYRLGWVPAILAERGPAALYLDHVFRCQPAFWPKLGAALELSRSFLRPDYQRSSDGLAALWKGLGAAARHFGAERYVGSVTISAAHHAATRALLVAYLQRHHADTSELSRLVAPRRPFQPSTRYHDLLAEAYPANALSQLAPIVEGIETEGRGIPPLMRYYVNLGARFLGFHVEASFGNALYCLLRVDLAAIPAAYRKRFLE